MWVIYGIFRKANTFKAPSYLDMNHYISMNRLSIYTVFFFVVVLFAGACRETTIDLQEEEHPFDKEYPNDLFTFQRSYPYQKFDIKAYEKGLEEAQTSRTARSNINPGVNLAWTQQGPGNFGGRVNSVAVHPSDEDIMYLGFATGGVFKTINGGLSWDPIFDEQPFLAIGDIALDPVNPDIIYVGTGDPNISGYPAIGDGLYRSADGGTTWDFLGLQDQRIISKIIIDPNDTDIVYVSCMGLPFERNNDRGLYKTVDGGVNWQQVLFVSNQSGIIDMVMDPTDSDILYASSWDRVRNNEESTVAGPNGKIHKTTDGGATWTALSSGLPSGTVGRIGLDISKNNPDVLVSVFISSSSNLLGVYKTEDGGASWFEIPTETSNGLNSNVMGGFGWYFGQIRLHPNNDDWIYMLGVQAWFTSNNGTVWSITTGTGVNAPHVDYHDLVFNFENDIIIGNDGGAYKRESNGSSYVDIENLPTTQIYRVAYDPHRPNNFYGGTQDNGTLVGNASAINNWIRLIGGDGFQMQFNPSDSNIVFTELQRGNIFRSPNGLTGFVNATTGIFPSDRRHWDMQYFISPHADNRLYTGTYRVFKTETTGAPSWNAISDDLTDGSIYGDAFHTITTLDESKQSEGLIYVGTTDANVWRTEDGGTTWDSIHMSLPERYITSVKADPDAVDRVYVCVSGYRYNEYIPRVYRSNDRGESWESIAGNLPDLAVNDIIIVPGQDGQVLFVATDGGVYVTTNAGVNWERLGNNMPIVTTYDLAINEAQNLLVAGTFGRSIYSYPIDSVLNNINPEFSISGQIRTINGVGIDSVLMDFGNATYPITQVDASGNYQLNNLTGDATCEISPAKDINIRNGISTLDMVLMQKHILNLDTLDSPYKILAGDVTNDGNMSTFDIVIARRVLLEYQDTFLNTPSWNFVHADYNFVDPVHPYDEDYSLSVTCADLQTGASGDFIGFKMGDVNASADPGMLNAPTEDRDYTPLELDVQNILLMPGEVYEIPIKVTKDLEINGFQFGLSFKQCDFLGIRTNDALSIDESNYNYKASSKDLLMSWSSAISARIYEQENFIYLKIKPLAIVNLSEAVQINSDVLASEIYENNTLFTPEFNFLLPKTETSSGLKALPNPATESTTLFLESTVADDAELLIYGINGEIVLKEEIQLTAGSNMFVIDRQKLPMTGLYFCTIKTKANLYQTKLIFE